MVMLTFLKLNAQVGAWLQIGQKMKLFLSYSRKNRSDVDKLAKILQDGGHDVWIDDAIRTGEKWKAALYDAIVDSDGIVLTMSPDWIASRYCQWEFITAVEQNKNVIPVLIKHTDIPERISQYQYVDFTGGFEDDDKIERFLDDLVALAVQVDQSAISDMSKAELEQQIAIGNVRDSAVTIHQSRQNDSEANGQQGVTTGNIEGSTVNFSQHSTSIESQTIHQGEKQRNWNSAYVVGLIVALVGVIFAIIAVLPETQRNNTLYSIGLIPASPTPTATHTPTSTPTITPSPTLTPEPTIPPLDPSGFNVVVAGFGFQVTDGTIREGRVADIMSDIVVGELNQITQIDNTVGWRNASVGRILGDTPTAREAQAAEIAQALNANVVVYGIVRADDDIFYSYEPEFFITAEFAALEPELVGADTLGNPLDFVGDSEDQILAANTVQRRLGVMRFFLRGLAFYLAGNFEGSVASFEEALEVESEGLEILYVFAGNAAVRIPDTEQSLEFYNQGLRQRPEYARALVGRGIALYSLARETAGDDPPPYDPELELDPKLRCSDVDEDLPDSAQLLGELALRCYLEAGLSPDQPDTADIDVKVAFGIGQTSLWMSLTGYADLWEDVLDQLSKVVAFYESSSEDRQSRIRAATAHANAWLGLRLLSLDGNDETSVCNALNNYRTAIGLLRSDINREYNQRWIDLYGQQVGALEDWLNDRDVGCDVGD